MTIVHRAPFHTLRSFLAALADAGELVRVPVEVDPRYEITQIVQEVGARNGPAVLFERVKGSPYPLAINLLGTIRRIEIAFGRHPEAIGAEFLRLGTRLMPPTLGGVLGEWKALARFRHMRPSFGRTPRWREEVAGGFDALPVLTCWPKDAGRFLTFGQVISANPKTGHQNVGVYRMQVLDPRRVAMHWQIERGGGAHAAAQTARTMPVAIVIGADPATMFSGVAPLPEDVDELHFAGLLRGGSTRLARGTAVPLDLPAEAEFMIEGTVSLDEKAAEGPFGDHFGHYSHQAPFPVFTAARMAHRPDPIYVASVVGKPPQEDRAIGDAVQMIFTPILRLIHPNLVDLWAHYETGFHNLLVASVRQRYAKEGVKTALGLLGQGQLSLAKCLVLVDPDVNPRSFPDVLRAIQANFNPAEDLLVLHRTALDTLDFTSYEMNLGSKMILDATSAGGTTPPVKPVAAPTPVDGVGAARVWQHTLLAVRAGNRAPVLGVPAADGGEGRALLERVVAKNPQFRIVAAVSEDVDLKDDVSLLWGIFTRFDCARDVFFGESTIRGVWPHFSGPMAIDATYKKGYPEPVTMLPDIEALVQQRWQNYQLPS